MATELATMVADFRTTLATEIAIGGTSGTLQSITDADGNTLANGTYYFTLDGDGTAKEHIKCTLTGTALSNIRTVSRKGVQASGTVRKHRIGAMVQITNFAHIKYMLDLLDGTTDFDASTPLKYDGVPTITSGMVETLATVDYVNGVALAGAPDAQTNVKGVVELATVAEQGTAEAVGSTGAALIPANANLVKTSSGADDENKIAILNASGVFADGFLDAARTWTTVQSFTADNLQITTDPDNADDAVRKSYADAQALLEATTLRFGDSSDGAFAESSGTTTWNTATKNIYRFSSFSLTGTADVQIGSNLQNKRIFVLVNGDLTITSSTVPAVTVAGRGGSGATGAISLSAQNGTAGNGIQKVASTGGIGGSASTDPAAFNASGGGGGASCVTAGTAGVLGSGGTGNTAGTAGGTGLLSGASSSSPLTITQWLSILGCGDGGGAGGGSTGGSRAGGNGGAGGGCIIFLVKGNINITSTISAAGSSGSAGTNNGSNYYTGGGGGGGGGSIAIFYGGSVTANTATLTVSAGSGGAGGGGSAGGRWCTVVRALGW
jgi:hypothetical protein